MKTVAVDRGRRRDVDTAGGRASALAVVALLTVMGIAVVRARPSATPEPLPSGEIVVVGGQKATTSVTERLPSPAPAAEPATAPRLTYHPLIGRIDPLLDTIMASADGDVRMLHDQIAQQKTGGLDAAREAALDTALSATTGNRPIRIICADTICEIVGRTESRRSLENEALANQLAHQNLSLGPVAHDRPDRSGSMLFVRYVVAEGQ